MPEQPPYSLVTGGVGLAEDFEARAPQNVRKHRDVEISAAQLLALFATPQIIVPAPGAGKFLLFDGAMLFLDYNSVAYSGIAAGEDLSVKYTGAAGLEIAQIETTGFLDQTADQLRWARPNAAASGPGGITPVVNSPLVLHLLVAEIAAGDSPLRVRVFYHVLPSTI